MSLAVLGVINSAAEETTITVHTAWAPGAPPTARVWAAYMILENTSDAALSLVGANSPAFERIEFHKSEIRNDIARMIPQGEIAIPANSKFAFEPGGYHFMLIGPKDMAGAGKSFKLTLEFDNGSTVPVTVAIRPGHAGSQHHHHHHH